MLAPIYLTYRTYRVYMGGSKRSADAGNVGSPPGHDRSAGGSDRRQGPDDATSHILRVQFYAGGLAEAIGLSAEEIQAVKTAALLHDIGKLAIPEHILSKPGPLTPEEFQKVRIHPQVGAEIIARRAVSVSGGPIDSQPPRTMGRQRISQRDRRAKRFRSARGSSPSSTTTTPSPRSGRITTRSAAKAPWICCSTRPDARWIRRWSTCSSSSCPSSSPAAKRGREARRRRSKPQRFGGRSGRRQPRIGRATAFENIGLAHREIYALYEIAQSMGTSLGVADTMELISSKLAKIIPWSGCALFLQQQDPDVLRCRYATGVDAPRLLDASIRVGKGLSGWVARNRRILVNASPRVEFEAAGVDADRLHSAIVCPLYLGDTFIGSLALFHTEANRYTDDHRRLITSVAEQAGAVDPQLDRVRTGARGFADGSADVAAQSPLAVRAASATSWRGRSGSQSELAMIVLDIDEFKRINDTLRAPRRRRMCCARSRTPCARRCASTTCASASPATSSSSSSRDCGRESGGEQAARTAASTSARSKSRLRSYSGKRIQLRRQRRRGRVPSRRPNLRRAARTGRPPDVSGQVDAPRRARPGRTRSRSDWQEAAPSRGSHGIGIANR